jgi:hypothetical protein
MQKLAQYLSKNSFRPELITANPKENLGMVVVIPAHDEKDLIASVSCLQDCITPNCAVEVIVIFNASEDSAISIIDVNNRAMRNLQTWFSAIEKPTFELYCIAENNLPKKHAGVGLARKIGMDEAVRRFNKTNFADGIVLCFDADSKCEENYLVEVEKHFKKNIETGACSIHFEHPIYGNEFSVDVYKGIENYELHLRYYKNGLAYAHLPFAYHTIGSSMAVRVSAYCEQGGMNRRKAGEDFYFLQKFIDVGLLSELKSTTLIPSPRPSHRVPFGTGRAIQEMIDAEREIDKSYAFECFNVIKECFENVRHWYHANTEVNEILLAFIGEEKWNSKLEEIRSQSSTLERFEKRFFQWFNAFQTLKFIHYLRDHHFPNQLLVQEVPRLLEQLGISKTNESLLNELRQLDRN